MAILDDILERKRQDVSAREKRIALARLREQARRFAPPRDFAAALKRPSGGPVRLLAEIKAASPSEGVIREDFDAAGIAETYETAGAAAISVLTEEHFFGGGDGHLIDVHGAVDIPVLRKDFTIGEYQIWEARSIHADAVLLMCQILDEPQLTEYLQLTRSLGMTALVEAHTEAQLEKAVACGARVIGINNRNFDTLTTDLATTERLRGNVPPDRVLVSQSGISTRDDIKRLADAGVDAVQIGTSIMRHENIAGFLAGLLGDN